MEGAEECPDSKKES